MISSRSSFFQRDSLRTLNTFFFVWDVRSQLLLFLDLLCDSFLNFKLLWMSGEEVPSSRFPRVDLKDPKEVNIPIIR